MEGPNGEKDGCLVGYLEYNSTRQIAGWVAMKPD